MQQGNQQHWVDLHMHSNRSDGSLSPRELARLAVREGLGMVSLTDHDTVAGLPEMRRELARHPKVKLVPGIELSTLYSRGTCHILGYGFNEDDPALRAHLQEFQADRRQRNDRMLKKLAKLGIEITPEEISQVTKDAKSLGRPHLAAILIQRGLVSTVQEAFAEYLSSKGKAYVPRRSLQPWEAIQLIHRAGGKAFLAHPVTLRLKGDKLKRELQRFQEAGLAGIEAFSSAHLPEESQSFLQLAQELSLMVSGGSDFHGESKPQVRLGRHLEESRITASLISWDFFHSQAHKPESSAS